MEEGIEIGKKMMAEMIASYSNPGASASGTAPASAAKPAPAAAPASDGRGYLNEVSPLNARSDQS